MQPRGIYFKAVKAIDPRIKPLLQSCGLAFRQNRLIKINRLTYDNSRLLRSQSPLPCPCIFLKGHERVLENAEDFKIRSEQGLNFVKVKPVIS